MSEMLNSLNEAQKKAVVHETGPLLIVAGAGTGKTTVITSKITWLVVERGVKPEEILALTFTEKAAAEMEERVDRLLPLGYADLWISTFHSFAERILKEHALEIGLPQDFKLLNTTSQWLLVRQNLDRFNLDYYRPLGNPTKFIHALLKLFSRAKDENVSASDYLAYAERLRLDAEEIRKQQEIADAYHVYQQLLLENNALDFGDLINYVLKLFQTRKNILFRYQNQFKQILVDEFQDTNYAQYELVKLLGGSRRNITVVGDDDQAIYKFRGASVSNIMQFKDDYPEAEEIYLTDNYRSCQNILDLSYEFIQRNNPDRLEIKLAAANKLSKRLKSSREQKGIIKHLHGRKLVDEVELAVNTIIERYNQDKEAKWSDFAVLVRANHGAEDFCHALESAKVPYVFMASRGLYQKPIILNILSWFRILDDYHESSAFYRIMNFPFWPMAESDIMNLNYWANRKGWSLFETARQNSLFSNISDSARLKLKKILALIESQSALARAGRKPTQILTEFLNQSGYLKLLTATDSPANQEALHCLNQFMRKLADFEKEVIGADLAAFRNLIELELEAGESGALAANLEDLGPEAVKIMTIHASKGLEFKHVIIANMVDKKFPSIAKSDLIELPTALVKEKIPEGDIHLAEERRLFYVAMTRAKDSLYFSSADDYGGARAKKISRFLAELAEDGFHLSENYQADPSSAKAANLPVETVKARKTMAEERRIAAPKQFSFTQLKNYEKCPYQYRFAHILKIPISGKPQFSFGKSMHSAMQKFFILARSRSAASQPDLFSRGEKPLAISWEEVRGIYTASFIDDWYPNQKTKQEYYDRGLVSMKKFFDEWQINKPLAEHLEYGFTFKLNRDCALRGAIDRIDKDGAGIKLIDYKTGAPKEKLATEDKEQLLIYQMAAQEILKQPVTGLIFYYFDNNSEISFLGADKEIEKLKDKIIGTIDEIKIGKFEPKPEKEKCRWCDYKAICDFAE